MKAYRMEGVSIELRGKRVGDWIGYFPAHDHTPDGSLVWHVNAERGELLMVPDSPLNRLRCWWKRRREAVV
jgi:hypothetical protein